jgi:hypothetical protein
MPVSDNLEVGIPDVDPEAPSHVEGVIEGNSTGSYEQMEGHFDDGTSDARRSTGVDPDSKNPILPEMPNLSPA